MLPHLRMGRASDMLAPHEMPDITNVAVRLHDRPAFLGIIAQREEQIEKFGHTPEKDASEPAIHLPKQVARYAQDAVEELQFGRDRRAQAIKKLERTAALAIAAIGRLKEQDNV